MPKPANPGFCLTTYGQEQMARYVGWAMVGVESWTRTRPHLTEELRTAGYVGLSHAVAYFDPKRDAAFTTFLTTCVRRACSSAVKTANRQMRSPSGQMVCSLSDAVVPTEDRAPDLIDERDQLKFVSRCMRCLCSRSRHIVLDHTVSGRTFREIAAKRHLSHERARQIYTAAIDRLREIPAVAALRPD